MKDYIELNPKICFSESLSYSIKNIIIKNIIIKILGIIPSPQQNKNAKTLINMTYNYLNH